MSETSTPYTPTDTAIAALTAALPLVHESALPFLDAPDVTGDQAQAALLAVTADADGRVAARLAILVGMAVSLASWPHAEGIPPSQLIAGMRSALEAVEQLWSEL